MQGLASVGTKENPLPGQHGDANWHLQKHQHPKHRQMHAAGPPDQHSVPAGPETTPAPATLQVILVLINMRLICKAGSKDSALLCNIICPVSDNVPRLRLEFAEGTRGHSSSRASRSEQGLPFPSLPSLPFPSLPFQSGRVEADSGHE